MLLVLLSVVHLLLLWVHVVVVSHVVIIVISKVALRKVLMMLRLLLMLLLLLLLLVLLLLLHFKIIRIVLLRTLIWIIVLHGKGIIYFGIGQTGGFLHVPWRVGDDWHGVVGLTIGPHHLVVAVVSHVRRSLVPRLAPARDPRLHHPADGVGRVGAVEVGMWRLERRWRHLIIR